MKMNTQLTLIFFAWLMLTVALIISARRRPEPTPTFDTRLCLEYRRQADLFWPAWREQFVNDVLKKPREQSQVLGTFVPVKFVAKDGNYIWLHDPSVIYNPDGTRRTP